MTVVRDIPIVGSPDDFYELLSLMEVSNEPYGSAHGAKITSSGTGHFDRAAEFAECFRHADVVARKCAQFALEHARGVASLRRQWDGGTYLRESWASKIPQVLREFSTAELLEWAEDFGIPEGDIFSDVRMLAAIQLELVIDVASVAEPTARGLMSIWPQAETVVFYYLVGREGECLGRGAEPEITLWENYAIEFDESGTQVRCFFSEFAEAVNNEPEHMWASERLMRCRVLTADTRLQLPGRVGDQAVKVQTSSERWPSFHWFEDIHPAHVAARRIQIEQIIEGTIGDREFFVLHKPDQDDERNTWQVLAKCKNDALHLKLKLA